MASTMGMACVEHDGASLWYDVRGEGGPGVLLIQGIGVVGAGWLPAVAELAKKRRVAVFDNRGIGASTESDPRSRLSIEQMADDAAAVARACGWESCHVIGHSMGGVIAQRLALRHRALVKGLVLMCTIARGRDAVRFTPPMIWANARTSLGPRAWRRRAFLELIFPRERVRRMSRREAEQAAADLAPLFGRDLADQPPIIMRQARALRAHDCTPELEKLGGVPTLVLSASEDVLTLPRRGRELARAIPGARYMELEGAAHGAPMTHATQTAAVVESFFADAERAGR